MYRLLWQIAIASAWEFEGLRIEPQRLDLDPWVAKKMIPSLNSMPYLVSKKIARCMKKRFFFKSKRSRFGRKNRMNFLLFQHGKWNL